MDYFKDMIGQNSVKRKLGFFLDAHKTTSQVPFVMFSGGKGSGKNKFAKEFLKNVKNSDGSSRPTLELNCSILKNTAFLFETIYLTYIRDNNINIIWDELHSLPTDISMALLTICNSDPDPVREFRYQDTNFVFNFKRMGWAFLTTETDKIFPPLKDRFEVVDFEPYEKSELQDILKSNCDSVVFQDESLGMLGDILRGNPRSAVRCAEHVNTYCARFNKSIFGEKDFFELSKLINILPHGLLNTELSLLKELNSRGPSTLQMLVSATGLSRSAIQKDHEVHLMRKGFLKIEGLRKITVKGQDALNDCKIFIEKANATA